MIKTSSCTLAAALLLAACGQNTPDAPSSPSAQPPAVAAASTDASSAPPAFAVCRSCHATEAGRNGIGPTLHAVVGSKAAAVPGYTFSPALKSSGITWTRDSLDTWLQGPTRMVPGTKMVLPVSNPEKRKAIIDYLETLK